MTAEAGQAGLDLGNTANCRAIFEQILLEFVLQSDYSHVMAEPETRRTALLRQERSRATREQLVRTCLELWRERGFDETTVNDICDAAGVAKGTFYFHFPRKEDVLLELNLVAGERATADLDKLLAGDLTTADLLEKLLSSVAHRTERSPRPLVRRTVTEAFAARGGPWEMTRGDRPDFGTVFLRVFARGQARGEIDAGYPPRELGALFGWTVMQTMVSWANGMWDDDGRPASLARMLTRHARLFLHGAAAGTAHTTPNGPVG